MTIIEFSVCISIGLIVGAIVSQIMQVEMKHVNGYECNFKELKEKTENTVLLMRRDNEKLREEVKGLHRTLELLTSESKQKYFYIDESNNVQPQNTTK